MLANPTFRITARNWKLDNSREFAGDMQAFDELGEPSRNGPEVCGVPTHELPRTKKLTPRTEYGGDHSAYGLRLGSAYPAGNKR